MVLLRFICCMFIFLCGVGSGVCIMLLFQIKRREEESLISIDDLKDGKIKSKSFEEKYNDLIVEEKESFSYDCLNDKEV